MSAPGGLVELGYLVGPTDQDYKSAVEYAVQKARKKICEAHPDKYKWVPDATVGFSCPSPLQCVSGTCEFTEQGCDAASVYPYYDCERHDIKCDLPTHNTFGANLNCNQYDLACVELQEQYAKSGKPGTCQTCTYKLHNNKADTPKVAGGAPPGCYPGDYKFLHLYNPEEDKKSHEEDKTAGALCQSSYDPDPIRVDGNPISCQTDDDCSKSINGTYLTDAVCMKYPQAKAYNQCVDRSPSMRYLEYRKNFVQYTEDKGKDQCVLAQPMFRKWCEMPWSRPAKDEMDVVTPLEKQIAAHPQTKMHVPYYYDTYSGNCYMTKEYCSNSIEQGGFETSFGKSHEYLGKVFSSCTNPRGNDASVRQGYDCCTPFGQSVAQFFIGKTLLTEINDVVHGRLSFAELVAMNPAKAYILYSLSDDHVKEDVTLIQHDFAGPGMHAYVFKWSPLAHQLYPDQTGYSQEYRLGLMARDIAAVYPDAVTPNEYGHLFVTTVPELYEHDAGYRRVVHALQLFDTFARQKLS